MAGTRKKAKSDTSTTTTQITPTLSERKAATITFRNQDLVRSILSFLPFSVIVLSAGINKLFSQICKADWVRHSHLEIEYRSIKNCKYPATQRYLVRKFAFAIKRGCTDEPDESKEPDKDKKHTQSFWLTKLHIEDVSSAPDINTLLLKTLNSSYFDRSAISILNYILKKEMIVHLKELENLWVFINKQIANNKMEVTAPLIKYSEHAKKLFSPFGFSPSSFQANLLLLWKQNLTQEYVFSIVSHTLPKTDLLATLEKSHREHPSPMLDEELGHLLSQQGNPSGMELLKKAAEHRGSAAYKLFVINRNNPIESKQWLQKAIQLGERIALDYKNAELIGKEAFTSRLKDLFLTTADQKLRAHFAKQLYCLYKTDLANRNQSWWWYIVDIFFGKKYYETCALIQGDKPIAIYAKIIINACKDDLDQIRKLKSALPPNQHTILIDFLKVGKNEKLLEPFMLHALKKHCPEILQDIDPQIMRELSSDTMSRIVVSSPLNTTASSCSSTSLILRSIPSSSSSNTDASITPQQQMQQVTTATSSSNHVSTPSLVNELNGTTNTQTTRTHSPGRNY